MGYHKHRRKRLNLRHGAAKMVELFTQIEMGVYDDKGRMRERRPLVLKSNTYEKLVGSQWEIEGLELKVNPLLYRGVRDPKTGEIGKNWWPTPKELAYIDHDNSARLSPWASFSLPDGVCKSPSPTWPILI